MAKYSIKDMVPIKHKLSITRSELIDMLNQVRLNPDTYNSFDIIELAIKFIEDNKI